jgi:two-component system sensor histidine kinase KdpD
MKIYAILSRKSSLANQFIICIGLVLISTILCYLGTPLIGYKTVAMILLMTVSFVAMFFDILPVLTAAILSSLIWNFFFIPPILTFHIDNTEDLLMFLMYFFIAFVNAVLTFKIRKEELKAREKEESEKSIKLYNTLLNSLSHELRTPISTIISAIDTLNDQSTKMHINEQKELFNEIEIASFRLNRQVENLLNMSRLESGMLKLKLDWCDMNEMINSVIQKLNCSQIIIFNQIDQLPLFRVDRILIEQSIYNILFNAICYTKPESTIRIKLNQEGSFLIISISDNGEGIPDDEIKNIFEKFYRLPQSEPGGSGLGLSIVKGFIEAHKGMISAEKNEMGGLTFKIKLSVEKSYVNYLKNE